MQLEAGSPVIPAFCLKLLPSEAALIDWVTAELPCLHVPLEAGLVCKVTPHGELEWASPCRVKVEGTFESSVQVRSLGSDGQGKATSIHFSGNPSKFLQGHNVFGSDDLVPLVYDAYLKVCRALGLTPTVMDCQAVRQGAYGLSTIDINQSYELPTRADVLAWIRAAEYKSKTRHGRPQLKGGTLYWGKSSQRWALKVYSKGEEIEAPKHRLPLALQNTQIAAWADNKLRLELRLKRKEMMELGIVQASQLTTERVKALFIDYVRKLEMTEQIPLSSEQQMNLPLRLQSTYVLWRDGQDLRSLLSRPTYYKHRKELLEYGIDIALRQDAASKINVIPLVRVLEAVPVDVPYWAFEQGLVHPSARRLA